MRLCQFFYCGRRFNFVQIPYSHDRFSKILRTFFVKNWSPIKPTYEKTNSFLLFIDLQPYSHDCFSKKSRTLFDFLNNTYWDSFFQRNNLRFFWTGVSCFSRTLFYSTLLALTYGQNDRQRVKYTCCAWAGGTYFPVVLLCQFLVLAGNRFWFYLLCTYVLRVKYSCGVV